MVHEVLIALERAQQYLVWHRSLLLAKQGEQLLGLLVVLFNTNKLLHHLASLAKLLEQSVYILDPST